jgi:hypothetical protein
MPAAVPLAGRVRCASLPCTEGTATRARVQVAGGESVIQRPSPPSELKDTHTSTIVAGIEHAQMSYSA